MLIFAERSQRMRALKNDRQQQTNPAKPVLRLVLRSNEVLRLPPTSQRVQVVLGTAWLTRGGQDVFLQKGEQAWLLNGKDFALVSPLNCAPLIVEVFGRSASASPRLLISAQLGQL